MIDLDANATTPLLPAAREAMLRVAGGNPSSAHALGRRARQQLEDAREEIAALLNARADEVHFTSGATEANNLAVFGLAGAIPGPILASRLEHPCIVEPLVALEKKGFAVDWLPATELGIVEQAEFRARATETTRLAVLMLLNHETGIVQPVRPIAKTLPKSVPLVCDAAQAVGKIAVDFQDLGAAALTASAHKFHGPPGIGLLILKKGMPFQPLLFGGHQQRSVRPGTEPVALVVGMATALRHAVANSESNRTKCVELRETFLGTLEPGYGVNGTADGWPGTVNLSFPGCRAELLLMALDLAGVACSTGSACSSGSLLPSPVLAAMGVSAENSASAMRFSFHAGNSTAELVEAAQWVNGSVRRLRKGHAVNAFSPNIEK